MTNVLTHDEQSVIDAVRLGARAGDGDDLNVDENDDGYLLFNHFDVFAAWVVYAGWDSYDNWVEDTGVEWDELNGKRWTTMHNRVFFE